MRPPFYSLFGLTTPKMKTYPLNLLCLATHARDIGGHEIALVDGENISIPGLAPSGEADSDPETVIHRAIPRMVETIENPDHPMWVELEQRILEQSPNIVGITCNSGNLDTARTIISRLKRHGIPIILGGSHPTVLPVQSIEYTFADMAAVGEGELTLVSVMDAVDKNGSLSGIPSLGTSGEPQA